MAEPSTQQRGGAQQSDGGVPAVRPSLLADRGAADPSLRPSSKATGSASSPGPSSDTTTPPPTTTMIAPDGEDHDGPPEDDVEEAGRSPSSVPSSPDDHAGAAAAAGHNNSTGHRRPIHDFFFPPGLQATALFQEDDDDGNGDGLRYRSSPRLGEPTLRMGPTSDRPPEIGRQHDGHNDRVVGGGGVRGQQQRRKPAGLQEPPATTTLDVPPADAPPHPSVAVVGGGAGAAGDAVYGTEEQQDKAFVETFWTAYDEILILSVFTQIGILCRLGAAYWFRYFDGVFHADSALFTNLPLNCLSCFVMGMLCSGESLMEIVSTRFTPPRLQQDLHREAQLAGRGHNNSSHHSRSTSPLPPQAEEDDDGHGDDDDTDNGGDLDEMETATGGGGGRDGTRRLRLRRLGRNHGGRRKRRRRPRTVLLHLQNEQDRSVRQELREVQLLAWERRIRASTCLLLFPVRQEDVDVVENYFSDGYRRESHNGRRVDRQLDEGHEGRDHPGREEWADEMVDEPLTGFDEGGDFDDLILEEEDDNGNHGPNLPQGNSTNPVPSSEGAEESAPRAGPSHIRSRKSRAHPVGGSSPATGDVDDAASPQGQMHAGGVPHVRAMQYAQVEGGNVVDYGTRNNPDLDQIITNVATGVSKNFSRFGRVNLANGWDVGTSPEEKSADLMLGLRDGLCGALSSFSSWISSMVHLFRTAQIGQAFVGLMLGIQLPLIAYRFGQYVSVYIFVWRCRREKRQDERRGYGIQLHTDEEGPQDDFTNRSHHSFDSNDDAPAGGSPRTSRTKGRRTVHDEESEVPSVRAIVTALFIMSLVAQLTSLKFFYEAEDRLLALSMLFSPLGVLVRWRMMKFNCWRPSFPIGTFLCNVTACALAGTLGTLLAGNPGPRERIVLVSIIAGFGGTLSSVARFIVEIIAGMDPILFRLDGVYYAIASVFWGLMVSLIFSASVDWADKTVSSTDSSASP